MIFKTREKKLMVMQSSAIKQVFETSLLKNASYMNFKLLFGLGPQYSAQGLLLALLLEIKSHRCQGPHEMSELAPCEFSSPPALAQIPNFMPLEEKKQ